VAYRHLPEPVVDRFNGHSQHLSNSTGIDTLGCDPLSPGHDNLGMSYYVAINDMCDVRLASLQPFPGVPEASSILSELMWTSASLASRQSWL
jgi:hypothetical protein